APIPDAPPVTTATFPAKFTPGGIHNALFYSHFLKMGLDTRTHALVQRRVMDSRNASARARRAHQSAQTQREVEALRREVERLRRLRAGDRAEITRLNGALEALQETL